MQLTAKETLRLLINFGYNITICQLSQYKEFLQPSGAKRGGGYQGRANYTFKDVILTAAMLDLKANGLPMALVSPFLRKEQKKADVPTVLKGCKGDFKWEYNINHLIVGLSGLLPLNGQVFEFRR